MAASHVFIILSTYNGVAHVAALVESIRSQTFEDWCLLVRDDGSSDATVDVVDKLAQQDPRILLLPQDGRGLGAPGSFGLLLAAARARGARYVFFADQDDVWLPGKLDRLLSVMADAEATVGSEMPVLVYSDLVVVAGDLRVIHASLRRYQWLTPPQQAEALRVLLTQNVVTGCGALLNRPLLDVVLPLPDEVVMHDWWAAQCAAATGRIVDVADATVLYRQHAANVVGAAGPWALASRMLRQPRWWWARGMRRFLLEVRQAEALGRRLRELPKTALVEESRELVGSYCRALSSPARPFERLRAIRQLGPRPITRRSRLLYYVRVLLYGRWRDVRS
jgi:glycosyltransferase involved in cell wall biosynthesis